MNPIDEHTVALLSEFLNSRGERYVEFASAAVAANPAQGSGAFTSRDLAQMVDGFLAVMNESLVGTRRDTRTFYLETVIPGLVAAGSSMPAVVHTVVGWTVYVIADFSAHHSGPVATAAIVWLSQFFAGYLADIARVGAGAGAVA
jgi:ABC-type amino acid transport system permease subunit